MTTPPSQALRELTEAIVKSVPEIMALEKGCVYICKEKGLGHELSIPTLTHLRNTEGTRLTEEDIAEIIGRPIGLEDVLSACRGKAVQCVEAFNKSNNCPEVFRDALYSDIEHEIVKRWYLGSPLSSQPPETISFLHSLLCPKK